MATHIVSDSDRHLSPLAYQSLAVLAGVIGIAASAVTSKFFILALERTEADGLAREALISAGLLMIAVELSAFFLAALLPSERLRALRVRLMLIGAALVIFEVVTLYFVQVALVQTSDHQQAGTAGRIAQLQASIAGNRRAAAALVATGERSGQSLIASSRADGTQALRSAAQIEARNAALAAALAQLQAGQRPTLSSVLGKDGMVWYSVARSVLIVMMGLVMFSTAGALWRAARGLAAKTGPAPSAAPAESPKVAPSPTARAARWAAAGAALPAAAFAMPAAAAATAPPYLAASYSAPLATAPAIAPNQVQSVSATAPDSVQSSDHGGAIEPPPTKQRTAPRKQRASVEVGHKMDSGVGPEDGYRYRRIRSAVQTGTLTPSIRAIQAEEGGGTEIVRAYLQQMVRDGVIERSGRGYKLV